MRRSTLKLEALETRVLLAADWQNPVNALDVDASGEIAPVSPMDALLVINELNLPQFSDPDSGQLFARDSADSSTAYFDVNGDGVVSPVDALQVVNSINGQSATVVTNGQSDPIIAPLASFSDSTVMAGTPAAAAAGAADPDTLVNSTTNRLQAESDVATADSGSSWVVWQSLNQDGSSWGIYGQRYDAAGTKLGDEFLINTTTQRSQRLPKVAIDDTQGLVAVAWQSLAQDDAGWGIVMRTFTMDGTAISGETIVNSTTRGRQSNPDIAFDDSGLLHIVWEGRGEGDNNGIFHATANIDDSGQVTIGEESLVNSHTRGDQSSPAVDAGPNGAWVVWHGKGADDASGVYVGRPGMESVLVNPSTSGYQKWADISVSDDNTVIVAYQAADRGAGVFARPMTVSTDTSGNSTISGGNEINVSQTTRGGQRAPVVAHMADGGFVVGWWGRGTGDANGVYTRRFDADGAAITDETIVNYTTRAGQIKPALAAANDGYIVTWQGRGEGDRRGVFARFVDSEFSGPFQLNPIDDVTVDEGDTISIMASVEYFDEASPAVTFSLPTAPAGMTIDSTSGVITWVTGEADGQGTYEVVVDATQDVFISSQSFMVTVNEVDVAPVLQPVEDLVTQVDEEFSITLVATDPDNNDFVTYSIVQTSGESLPAWLNLDSESGVLSGTPALADEGTISLTATATDSTGLTSSQSFELEIVANLAPTLVTPIGDQTADEAAAFSLDVSDNFNDPNDDMLTYTVENLSTGTTTLPEWLSFDSDTGVFSGTPSLQDVGTVNLRVTATDPEGLSVNDMFAITVVDVNNNAPVVSEQVMHVAADAENGTTVGQVLASDLDAGSVLGFSIQSGNDSGIYQIDSTTGVISVADSSNLSDGLETELVVVVSDGSFESMATITIYASSTDTTVAYSLMALDSAGNELSELTPDIDFTLVLTVQDSRQDGTGIFSAYADVTFPTDILEIDASSVVHQDPYLNQPHFDTTTAGLIDEAGGVDGVTELGTGVFEVWRVDMSVKSVPIGSTVNLAVNPADNVVTFPTLRFDDDMAIPASEISFGTLSLDVVSSAVSYTLSAESASGDPLTSVSPGSTFQLVLSVQDVSSSQPGVFSAYANINYPSDSVSVAGTVTHSSTFNGGTHADTTTAGLIDKAGGVDGLSPLGGAVFEVLRVDMMVSADASGTIVVSTGATGDTVQYPTLQFGSTAALADGLISFGDLSLEVVAPSSALSMSSSATTAFATGVETAHAGNPISIDEVIVPQRPVLAPWNALPEADLAALSSDTRDALFAKSSEHQTVWDDAWERPFINPFDDQGPM